MPSNHLIPCFPLLLLPSIFPSIRVFCSESVLCIRGPNYWSFSFSISLSNGYSGLTSFRIDWLDLLTAQGTLKSLLQHHSSSTLALSFLFSPSLTFIHDYWKTIALTRQTFVGKAMSLLFNTVQVCHQRRQWHPTPVLLPGKSYGRRSLVDCSPWGREELDTTEAT